MLNLYYNPLSPYGQKVMFFLEEAKIPYQAHPVDLAKGAQRTPAFKKLNPFGAVPVIELNGFSMGESNAILRYLAARYEKTSWYPTNLEDRARVDSLVEFVQLQPARGLFMLAWNITVAPMLGLAVSQGLIDEGRRLATVYLPKLDEHLAGRTYLYGPTPTLADAVLLPFTAMHQAAYVSLSDYPSIKAWNDRMTALPAWKKVEGEVHQLLAKFKK